MGPTITVMILTVLADGINDTVDHVLAKAKCLILLNKIIWF